MQIKTAESANRTACEIDWQNRSVSSAFVEPIMVYTVGYIARNGNCACFTSHKEDCHRATCISLKVPVLICLIIGRLTIVIFIARYIITLCDKTNYYVHIHITLCGTFMLNDSYCAL